MKIPVKMQQFNLPKPALLDSETVTSIQVLTNTIRASLTRFHRRHFWPGSCRQSCCRTDRLQV